MRTGRFLALAALSLPSLAAAQVYIPAPPFAPRVEVQGRMYFHWGRRRYLPPTVYIAAPPPPPVYVEQPPVVYQPPPPVMYQQPPVYAPPPPVMYQQPPVYAPPPPVNPYPNCCAAPARAAMPGQVIVQTAVKPEWTSRFGLGATYEGLISIDTGTNTGMGFLG